tara:strand:+ start:2516 stop:2971 length:456 start_codon:yes stop_codon:yes gene_type:complete
LSKKSEIQIGRAGELIASGVIEALGYRTVLCQQASFDMLLMRDDGTHYRVEVKTTSKAKGDPRKADGSGATRYSFNTATGSGAKTRLDPTAVDMLCLVALDVRRVYFKPVFKHEVLRYNLTPEKILGVDELTQLNETLEDIDMRRLQCGVV